MVKRIVVISLIGNIILSALKLSFGYFGNSQSLFSDGLNSLSDVLVSVLILIVLKVAHKKPDKTHPYGHEKFEGVLYLLLSFIILITSLVLFGSGAKTIYEYIFSNIVPKTPMMVTVYVAITALIIKLFLYFLNHLSAIKYESSSLKAETKNHLFDILATSVSLISIIVSRFGFPYFEGIGTILIAGFVLYAGIKMIIEAISYLVDEAPDSETVKAIIKTIKSVKGVIEIDDLKARRHMNHIYVDVEISVLKELSLMEAHNIAHHVHDIVENEYNAIHCMVHVNPYLKKQEK